MKILVVLWSLSLSVLEKVEAEAIASSRRLSTPGRRRLGGLTPPQSRRLQYGSGTEICVDTASSDFSIATLGPSYAVDSLFNTAMLPYQLSTPWSSGLLDRELNVPIDSLAMYLNYGFLVGAISGVDPVPFVQKEESFGLDGKHTAELLSQHELLANFWKTTDKGQPPLLLVALHSDILQGNLEAAILLWLNDEDQLSRIDVTETDLILTATQVQEAIETELPDGYSNPNLSFNAYFLSNLGIPGMETSSGIFMGDGILVFGDYLGFDVVVNDYTHAHEFGHWVQYIMDLEDSGNDLSIIYKQLLFRTPEENRQSELEADAMAAYALAHEQGRNFDVGLLVQATKLAFAVGDCSTEVQNHHGTPKQRECAVKWGADEGLDMTGDPVSMREFRALFLANVDGILNLDPSMCTLTDDTGLSTGSPNTTSANTTNAGADLASPTMPDISDATMAVPQFASCFVVATTVSAILSLF
jgi:hypothetical protein